MGGRKRTRGSLYAEIWFMLVQESEKTGVVHAPGIGTSPRVPSRVIFALSSMPILRGRGSLRFKISLRAPGGFGEVGVILGCSKIGCCRSVRHSPPTCLLYHGLPRPHPPAEETAHGRLFGNPRPDCRCRRKVSQRCSRTVLDYRPRRFNPSGKGTPCINLRPR